MSLATDTRGQDETGEEASSHATDLPTTPGKVAEIRPLRMPLRKWHGHQVKQRKQFLSQWLTESSVKDGNGGSRKTHRKCVLGFGVPEKSREKASNMHPQEEAEPSPSGRAPACQPRACLLLYSSETIFTCVLTARAGLVCRGLLDALVLWYCWGSAFWCSSSLDEMVSGLFPTPPLSSLGNPSIYDTGLRPPGHTQRFRTPAQVL